MLSHILGTGHQARINGKGGAGDCNVSNRDELEGRMPDMFPDNFPIPVFDAFASVPLMKAGQNENNNTYYL
jgi:hypothetical protein